MSSSRELLSIFLQTCRDPRSLTQIHSLLLKNGLLTAPDCFFATKLTSAYSNLPSPLVARKLFDEIPRPNTHLFNAILRAHSRSNQWKQTLLLFQQVAKPDPFTFPMALRACANLMELGLGKAIHCLVLKHPSASSDMFVGSSLIEFYSKCSSMHYAARVFDAFQDPDIVLWTSVLTGYQQNHNVEEAVLFFSKMVVENGLVPTPVTLISLAGALEQLDDSRAAKCCHGYVTRMCLNSNLALINSILNLYSKLGAVQSAVRLFEIMAERDVVSWSSMIACYVHNGKPAEALEVYRRMVEMGFEPNEVTLISTIQACAQALDLEEGRRMHKLVIRKCCELDASVSTSLLDMYMKCGCYNDAMTLFRRMPKSDAVSWSAAIDGCAQNGFASEALKLFTTMQLTRVRPDAVTMVKVLSACSQLGLLHQARCFHSYLFVTGFTNKIFVLTALIDLYSKCGSLDEAVRVFGEISEKDVTLWSAMISGYATHGLASKAIEVFGRMIESSVRPNSVIFVSLLSACSHAGWVTEGKRIFNDMSCVYRVIPDREHYDIMVDLLSRNGELSEALRIAEGAPGSIGSHGWCALLAGCRMQRNVEMGEIVGKKLIETGDGHGGYYGLLSDVYAVGGRWSDVVELRGLVKERGVRRIPGCSSVEVGSKAHSFFAGEMLHQQWERLYEMLRGLEAEMRERG